RARRAERLGAEDGVRRLVEGHDGAPARDPRGGASLRRRRRARGGVGRVAAGPARAASVRRTFGGGKGMALGGRDGRDREDVRRSRRAVGVPRGGGGVLPLMIAARGLEKRFGDRRVLRGVDVDLPDEGFLLVTGRNGSGKTTLLRILAGLTSCDAG